VLRNFAFKRRSKPLPNQHWSRRTCHFSESSVSTAFHYTLLRRSASPAQRSSQCDVLHRSFTREQSVVPYPPHLCYVSSSAGDLHAAGCRTAAAPSAARLPSALPAAALAAQWAVTPAAATPLGRTPRPPAAAAAAAAAPAPLLRPAPAAAASAAAGTMALRAGCRSGALFAAPRRAAGCCQRRRRAAAAAHAAGAAMPGGLTPAAAARTAPLPRPPGWAGRLGRAAAPVEVSLFTVTVILALLLLPSHSRRIPGRQHL